MKDSHFKNWVQGKYFDNCEERRIYNQTPLVLKEYWSNNKWFLKKLFKNESKKISRR